jgi:Stress responsive A/B Barrel Domain.
MRKQNRRTFLATAAMAGLTLAVPTPTRAAAKQSLVHHVFFWLKNPDSVDDLSKLIEGISTLKKIPTIKKFKIGLPANTTKRDVIDDSYSVSELTMFDDVKGHDVYQDHPIHLKFIADYSHLWAKVVVYDSMDVQS